MQRKIWVRRPGASATIVSVHEDDLVDSVRDVILRKYSNSLGKSIDSPDITLRIISQEQTNKSVSSERSLGPEESIGRTLDAYYPGGQTIDDALLIEVPQKRTPRASPRVGNHHVPYYIAEEYRPGDGAREYFPPMAPLHSPHLSSHQHPGTGHASTHSMAVLTTGQLPPLPSPGAHSSRRHARPKYGRQHTSSPTILHTTQPNGGSIDPKAQLNGINATPALPLPTPPAQNPNDQHKPSITPPNRSSSPHPSQRNRRTKTQKAPVANTSSRSMNGDPPPALKPASVSLLDGNVPPINVLIVEDNIINLKLLEAFMKRLKVRWKSAMNGKEAVVMWRTGGFHLVLMDIQLPVMNGLEATKEIRRLEGVNGIGVFSGSPIEGVQTVNGDWEGGAHGDDKLGDRSLFKSPVIIVALTASSLQSDRHEALAAGCNDFLTKPVNFVWMERKVTEWGCMQALIDYDGWRKWKEYASQKEGRDPAIKEREEKEERAKSKAQLRAMFSRPPPSVKKDEPATPAADKAKDQEKVGGTLSNPVNNGPAVGGAVPPKKAVGNANRGHKSRGSVVLGTTPEGDETAEQS